MESLIIPSAIQRIRSFLIEMSGMKVKPWATTEETLAALHVTLVARRGCSIFWASLRTLLETLARDLKTRQAALPGALVDNELLDSDRYVTLVDEIRAALEGQSAEPSTFRRLAASLSAPALGLLLFLGGAASIGCERTGIAGPTKDAGPLELVDAMTTPPLPDAAPAPTNGDARVTRPEANPDLAFILLPDTRPATDVAVIPKATDGSTVTIQDIMHTCNMSDGEQGAVLNCLAKMAAGWDTGLADTFGGVDCTKVVSQLNCLVRSQLCGSYEYTATWSGPGSELVCKPMIIYAGVRFV